ncbi:MAG: hypothetical protein ACRCXY_05740 [Fusobacteriaceae bacterium]
MLTVVVRFGILSKLIILFLFLSFKYSFPNKSTDYEKEEKYEESLENIKFISIEKSDSLLMISKVRVLSVNGNLYGVIIFDDGKKYIIKREKEIEINKNKYKVRIFNEKIIEIENSEKQISYIKVAK